MTDPPPAGWIIWPDNDITRRKRYHFVTAPCGGIVFRSRLLIECVDYLDAEGISAYRLQWGSPDHVTLDCHRTNREE